MANISRPENQPQLTRIRCQPVAASCTPPSAAVVLGFPPGGSGEARTCATLRRSKVFL
jgi:hypothetical protein